MPLPSPDRLRERLEVHLERTARARVERPRAPGTAWRLAARAGGGWVLRRLIQLAGADAHYAFGYGAFNRGRFFSAAEAFQDAADSFALKFGSGSDRVRDARSMLIWSLAKSGQFHRAVPLFEDLVTIVATRARAVEAHDEWVRRDLGELMISHHAEAPEGTLLSNLRAHAGTFIAQPGVTSIYVGLLVAERLVLTDDPKGQHQLRMVDGAGRPLTLVEGPPRALFRALADAWLEWAQRDGRNATVTDDLTN